MDVYMGLRHNHWQRICIHIDFHSFHLNNFSHSFLTGPPYKHANGSSRKIILCIEKKKQSTPSTKRFLVSLSTAACCCLLKLINQHRKRNEIIVAMVARFHRSVSRWSIFWHFDIFIYFPFLFFSFPSFSPRSPTQFSPWKSMWMMKQN